MATTAIAGDAPSRPRQNWILNSWLDFLFIIGAPVLALIWAILTIKAIGPSFGASAVWIIFMVFNIGHHLPTFIRIYGDLDLLNRFRWQLLLAPILPFTLAMWAIWTLIDSGIDVTGLMLMTMLLVIWDPWHFIMQHYGFMRIYDRHNLAPRNIAARLDMLLCMSWFVYMMVSASWLPDVVYRAYTLHGLDLVQWFTPTVRAIIESIALAVAILSTVGYLAYLAWCKSNGYYISYAKLTLMLVTFGIMYVAYVPNPLINQVVTGWTFLAGFATLGMVHVTQYMAIVWKYNRGLVNRGGKNARAGLFLLFGRAGWVGLGVAVSYVSFCLVYGLILRDNILTYSLAWLVPSIQGAELLKWFNGILASAAFTSTLLHYYYDGFIWKIRHKENQQNLELNREDTNEEADARPAPKSWWEAHRETHSAGYVFMKHVAYFGIPIIVLMWSYYASMREEDRAPLGQLQRISRLYRSGTVGDEPLAGAVAAVQKRLRIERAMAEMSPDPSRLLYIGDMIELLGTTKLEVTLVRARRTPRKEEIDAYVKTLKECRDFYERALKLPGDKAHDERPQLMGAPQDVQDKLISMHLEMLSKAIEQYEAGVPPGGSPGVPGGPAGQGMPGGLQPMVPGIGPGGPRRLGGGQIGAGSPFLPGNKGKKR